MVSELERFDPLSKQEARLQLDLDPGKKYLLYIGKLNYTKNPDILIDIFAEIRKDRNDIELLIAGTNEGDPLIDMLLKLVQKFTEGFYIQKCINIFLC